MALQNGLPLARAKSSRRWPTTIGRIRSAQVQYYSVPAGRTSFSYYAPSIVYEYTLDGKHFERTALVKEPSRKLDDADAPVKRYRSGQQVAVRYDPSRPARAMLEGEYVGGSQVLTFFGCILVACGALMLWR